MADDSIFLDVSYPGDIDETKDKALMKLALSYDGHWVGQGQDLTDPYRRDLEFEFSNQRRAKLFCDELYLRYDDITVTFFPPGIIDQVLAWDISAEERGH